MKKIIRVLYKRNHRENLQLQKITDDVVKGRDNVDCLVAFEQNLMICLILPLNVYIIMCKVDRQHYLLTENKK